MICSKFCVKLLLLGVCAIAVPTIAIEAIQAPTLSTESSQVDCRLVFCPSPTCLNPLPADPANGICCPRCPTVDCSVVLCALPTCLNPIPADPERGVCCSTCPKVDCSAVLCAVPNCPDPIPADIENGICCSTCPPGSTCPIDGQFFQSCGSGCPPTCDDPDITCDPQCVPGCHCPPGQLIDTVGRTCFVPEECPDVNICKLEADPGPCRGSFPRLFFNSEAGECEKFIFGGCLGNDNNFENLEDCILACDSNVQCSGLRCPPLTCSNPIPADPDNGICCDSCPPEIQTCELSADPGPCKAAITRYFYNSDTMRCEQFIYGGCKGNENNFQSLLECELECSECAPTCTPEYCSDNPKSKCSLPPGTPREIPGCTGVCDETVCNACYSSSTPLPLPPLKPSCPTTCSVDSNGVISSKCLYKWGKCVNNGCLKIYGKAVHAIADSENLRCWRPSCPLKG